MWTRKKCATVEFSHNVREKVWVWNCLSPVQIWNWTVLGYRISILLIKRSTAFIQAHHTQARRSTTRAKRRTILIVWQRLTSILLQTTGKRAAPMRTLQAMRYGDHAYMCIAPAKLYFSFMFILFTSWSVYYRESNVAIVPFFDRNPCNSLWLTLIHILESQWLNDFTIFGDAEIPCDHFNHGGTNRGRARVRASDSRKSMWQSVVFLFVYSFKIIRSCCIDLDDNGACFFRSILIEPSQ